ncbi:L,D-transpeptidase catalytic domain [Maribacter sedimenticola]|uniref:L,D-transpeptidase catalytic domain n=1 Tax=Maribacter sedimenticola TaxID=228956 RepID=A0ABY1SFM6_9FLAO|nr:L,D-transpeptidase [Maribacter sedimenticola]SNR39803.1 L,D-transpeptidase catalytic domain [Maribacter sedimenticola]
MKITIQICCLVFFVACQTNTQHYAEKMQSDSIGVAMEYRPLVEEKRFVQILNDVKVGAYFQYMDSVVNTYDSIVPYDLSEHLLVRHNPWIIDTLENTDYYRMIARDSFVYDQRQMIVLPKGSQLQIPDSLSACKLLEAFSNTEIDVNVPEYKLRIFQDSILLYTFPVRVGQHRERYLKFGDRVTDLRTKTGKGSIIKHVRHPDFYNPVNGKRFYVTKRDDEKTTMMPQIPWIETEINAIRNGQMIHPTTNPKTLGKAYSNGCIGLGEADSWRVYYYAPLGTKLRIRYDLKTYDEGMVISVLKDVYNLSN